MKKLTIILLFLIAAIVANAQIITLSPEKPAFNEEVTLTFNAKEGNGGLADYKGEVYAHAGLITNESTSVSDWKKVVTDWGDNQPKTKLTRIDDNTYQLKFKIAAFYGIPATGGNVTALAFVFRNEDGSKVGKESGDGDIYYFFKKATFKKPTETYTVSKTKTPEWSKYASIYEVNIRQYTEEGTINAFAEHLPRLRAMGIDILWIMPVQPIGEKKRKGPLGSYYSIQNYTAVNPEFGTIDDFKNLVQKAHGMGFKVVLDWVANHSSWDNEWIETNTNWYTKDENGNMIAPYDWTDVADLNYDMYYMRQAMTESMKYWITEADIDGFRCDVAGEVPLDFWEDTRKELDEVKEIWMIAEDGGQFYLLNNAFNANYGWHFHHLMNEVAKGNTSAAELVDYFEEAEKQYPEGTYQMQFITNHDENSWAGTVYERMGDGHKAFATLSFTVPGMPLIYSGQEAGLNKRLKFFEKDPIDWSDKSLLPFYTKLNDLKAENPALWNGTAGGYLHKLKNNQPEKVVAFSRTKGNSKVVTIINLSGEGQTATIQVGDDFGIYKDYFTGETVQLNKRTRFTLKPWQSHVLVFEKALSETKRTFQSIEETKTGLKVLTSDGTIVLTPYSETTIEAEFIPVGEQNPPSNAIAGTPSTLKTNVEENGNTLTYSTTALDVKITKEPFQITYLYNGQPLISEEKGFFDDGLNRGFRFTLTPDEMLTGGGERALGMNRRGKRLELYSKASYGYEETADLMYYSMPIVISSNKYMVIFDNGASGFIDLGATEENILQFEASGGRMSYMIVAATEWDELSSNFTALTGRQPMIPRWAMGNIASRMGYHSQAEVEKVVSLYKKEDIPLDAVVLDLFWFGPEIKGSLGNFDWHRDSFPKPIKMMKNFKSQGVKTILITEPFVLQNTATYEEVISKELVGEKADGSPYIYDFYFGTTTLLDIFKPATKSWFWNIYKKHTLSGVDGWWGDLGEPELHPDDLLHVNGTAEDVHNLYGHEWAKTVYEGFEKDFANRRPVILMRSGFVGSQRYGLVPWTGDVNRSWGGLKPQVEIALTMGMQGLAYMHSDLGGFAGDYEDAELYTRWLQYGVFQPIYRTHAQEFVPAEPVFWDTKTKDITRRYIKLRYQMMPYNYTLLYENTTEGVPMMRPLFYVDDNPALFENTTTYLWGDNFLVSPVVEQGATQQEVYFPKGSMWIDYWTGKVYEGGKTVNVPVTLEDIPVFVKAGSFIPMTPSVSSLSNYSSEKLEVHYYHDNYIAVRTGYMYEDDGELKGAYLQKKYEILRFQSAYDNLKESLMILIEPEGYDYKGKPKSRTVDVVVHNFDKKPKSVTVNGDAISDFGWDAKTKTVTVTCLVAKEVVEIRLK